MNKETPYIPSESQIFSAERERAAGSVANAAEAVKPAVEYHLDGFPSLTENEKQRLLMASRIYVVATKSQATRSWEAPTVAHHLGQARNAIVGVYRNRNVQEASRHISHDTQGNPYEFSTEMAGDEISYTLALAALTGNVGLLNEAIAKMDQLIASAHEPTAKTLTAFNHARLALKQSRSQEDFSVLKTRYQEATQASAQINRWERVATITARYSIDSIKTGHLIEAGKGLGGYLKAGMHDRSILTILPREIAKEATETIRNANWRRTTPPGVDYTTLKLP